MAIQDDVSNFFDRMLESGRQDSRRTDRAISVLPELDGRVRTSLEMYYPAEQFGSLEEAMRFDPLLVDRVMEAYDQQAGGLLDGGDYPDATMIPAPRPDTSGAVPRPRPAVPVTPTAPRPNVPTPYLPIEGVTNRGPDTGLGTAVVSGNVPGAAARAIAAETGQPTTQQLTETVTKVRETDPELAAQIEAGVRDAAITSMIGATMVPAAPAAAAAAPSAFGLAGLLQRLLGVVPKYTPPAALAPRLKQAIGVGTRFQKAPQGPAMNMTPAQIRTQQILDAARRAPGGYADGGRLRDNIINNYAMMADGGSGADAMVKVYSTSGERLTDDEDRINAMNRRMREDKIPLILSDYERRNDPDLRLLSKARKASSRADWQRYIDQQNSR